MPDLTPIIESLRVDEDRAHQRMMECMALFDKYLAIMGAPIAAVSSASIPNNGWIEVEPR